MRESCFDPHLNKQIVKNIKQTKNLTPQKHFKDYW